MNEEKVENTDAVPTNNKTPLLNNSKLWMISFVSLLVLLIIALGFYISCSNKSKIKSTPTQPLSQNELRHSPTPTLKANIVNEEKNEFPIYLNKDPSGTIELYAKLNPESFTLNIIARNGDSDTKLLEISDGYGVIIDSVSWSLRGYPNSNRQRLILKTIGPGDTSSDYLLSLDGSPSIKLEFPYTYYRFFKVLTWIDGERILVEQSDRNKDTGDKTIVHWVAPVSDLNQKKIVVF